MNWYLKVLQNYVEFDGRAQRKEYWYFFLFNVLIAFVLGMLDGSLDTYDHAAGLGLLSGIYWLIVLLPGIAVTTRRLHDTGKSGWLQLIVLIPLIGPIALMVMLALDSTPGTNRFGPNPKGVEAEPPEDAEPADQPA